MNKQNRRFSFTCAFLTLAVLFGMVAAAHPVRASLGGDATTIESDRAKMEASLQRTNNDRYVMHEMRAPNNVVVREFVSPAGKVFGVAWQGPVRPDLRQLLGPYFDTFIEAEKMQRAQHPTRGPLSITVEGLTVQMSGHPRAFVGKAYVSSLLPSNVRAEEIQ